MFLPVPAILSDTRYIGAGGKMLCAPALLRASLGSWSSYHVVSSSHRSMVLVHTASTLRSWWYKRLVCAKMPSNRLQ